MTSAALIVAMLVTPTALPTAAELKTQAPTLDKKIIERALRAYERLAAQGRVRRPTLTIIDYDLPSTERRLWTFDLASRRILFHELVAHGKGSGDDRAIRFSNEEGSLTSSLGVFVTAETYQGRHGLSLRLDGLEPGFNDQARKRAIVIHAADYVSESFAKKHSRLGRSWGCPAVQAAVLPELLAAVAEGSVLFVHASSEPWLTTSTYLR